MTNGILIADDSGAFRTAVRIYLALRNFEICGEAVDGNDVLEKATQLRPALIILDLRMPHLNGVEVASVLRTQMPRVRIVLLTTYEEVLSYKPLMQANGIDAIVRKRDCFDFLAKCVQTQLELPAL